MERIYSEKYPVELEEYEIESDESKGRKKEENNDEEEDDDHGGRRSDN